MLYSLPSSRKALQTWKAEEPKTAPQDEPAHPEKVAMARNTDGLCLKAQAHGIWTSRSPTDGTVVWKPAVGDGRKETGGLSLEAGPRQYQSPHR